MFSDPASYDRLMGRWSRRLAESSMKNEPPQRMDRVGNSIHSRGPMPGGPDLLMSLLQGHMLLGTAVSRSRRALGYRKVR
jgi:hypothetical protein